ncbi:hypothetical protein L1987_23100 [Smallanthus sonchifolius]|uniref:Uncharacterized protein n=1 Tax=Smallanthus sonchifolius TaxID=185202 RepID=A0ACB9II60_9ASTR|nr:hypothetical protein L1987_23100 [Smallanthus sonchifolius]
MNSISDNCSFLEELSVKRLHGIAGEHSIDPIKSCVASSSLKMISLKDLYNGQCFESLMVGSKNLKTLRLIRCFGDWDKLLQQVTNNVHGLIEIHLERVQVTDFGLAGVSDCKNLETIHLLKTPACSNLALIYVAENWLDVLSVNCRKLERLALCGSETVGDEEISCIAAKCVALRKLCIKSCPVSDHGMEALAVGCPNLVKVKKCKGVTSDGMGWLMASRGSLTVNVDATVVENQIVNAANDTRVLAVLPVGQDHPSLVLKGAHQEHDAYDVVIEIDAMGLHDEHVM